MYKTRSLVFALTMTFGCVEEEADDLLTNSQQELQHLPGGAVTSLRMKTAQRPHNIAGVSYSTPFGFAGNDYALDVAVDGAGNAYVTSTTATGCGAVTTSYVAKFNPSGFNVYFLCLPAGVNSESLAVDGAGNVYTAGGSTLSKIDSTGTSLIYSVNFTGLTMSEVAVDSAGNAYVAGCGTVGGKEREAQVAKLNAAGTALLFWVSFGGTMDDCATDLALDASNNVLVAGVTSSANFPVWNAFQSSRRGGGDGFVTKLSAAGNQILYSTYLGGDGSDFAFAIAADAAGNAWVGGSTSGFIGALNFPVTSGAPQLSPGGSGDGFIAKFNPAGGLVYSTYAGGSSTDGFYGIAVDATGSAYVTGYTLSTNYPIRGSAFQPTHGGGGGDGVVTQINAAGTSFVYSTYVGGAGGDNGMGIAVDAARNVYASGNTPSSNFPSNVYPHAGGSDAYLVKFAGP